MKVVVGGWPFLHFHTYIYVQKMNKGLNFADLLLLHLTLLYECTYFKEILKQEHLLTYKNQC